MVRCDGKINRGLNHYDSYSLSPTFLPVTIKVGLFLLLKLCYSKPELCRDKACKQRTEQLVKYRLHSFLSLFWVICKNHSTTTNEECH